EPVAPPLTLLGGEDHRQMRRVAAPSTVTARPAPLAQGRDEDETVGFDRARADLDDDELHARRVEDPFDGLDAGAGSPGLQPSEGATADAHHLGQVTLAQLEPAACLADVIAGREPVGPHGGSGCADAPTARSPWLAACGRCDFARDPVDEPARVCTLSSGDLVPP